MMEQAFKLALPNYFIKLHTFVVNQITIKIGPVPPLDINHHSSSDTQSDVKEKKEFLSSRMVALTLIGLASIYVMVMICKALSNRK